MFRGTSRFVRRCWDKVEDMIRAATALGVFIFIVGGMCWYYAEKTREDHFIDNIFSGMYYGSIFLLSEWCHVDFAFYGYILCLVYCMLGVALFSILSGAVFEAFGDSLTEYTEQCLQNSDFALTKEDYLMKEARERKRLMGKKTQAFDISTPKVENSSSTSSSGNRSGESSPGKKDR